MWVALVWNVIEVYNEGVILGSCPFLLFPLSSRVLLQQSLASLHHVHVPCGPQPFFLIAKFCQKEKFNFIFLKSDF
jgi:hypothetical protein